MPIAACARARPWKPIATMKRIWAQDPPYDFPGEFRTVQIKDAIIPALGIGIMPKPFQKPDPPITMSVSSRNSPTARVAGQQGWGILSGNNMPANAVATHWVSYSKACAEAGKPAQRRKLARGAQHHGGAE